MMAPMLLALSKSNGKKMVENGRKNFFFQSLTMFLLLLTHFNSLFTSDVI